MMLAVLVILFSVHLLAAPEVVPELAMDSGEVICFEDFKKVSEIPLEEPVFGGTIYLTFDDGPSKYTTELLDVLAKYDVKATFFVTSAGDDETIAREFNEGHAVGLHSASHNYGYIYQSLENYFADLDAIQARVQNATGQATNLLRFPGGSSNTVSRKHDGGTRIMSRLADEVTARGYSYFDWNVSSGDADGATTAAEVYNNVVNGLKRSGDSVVLQHDTKQFSVAAVEDIIKYGLAHGCTFEKLSVDSYAAHHRINN